MFEREALFYDALFCVFAIFKMFIFIIYYKKVLVSSTSRADVKFHFRYVLVRSSFFILLFNILYLLYQVSFLKNYHTISSIRLIISGLLIWKVH